LFSFAAFGQKMTIFHDVLEDDRVKLPKHRQFLIDLGSSLSQVPSANPHFHE